MWNLKPLNLFVFFFTLACEKVFNKTHSIENRCYRSGKYTVCRRIRASFIPETLHAGTVKGLTVQSNPKLGNQKSFYSHQQSCFKTTHHQQTRPLKVKSLTHNHNIEHSADCWAAISGIAEVLPCVVQNTSFLKSQYLPIIACVTIICVWAAWNETPMLIILVPLRQKAKSASAAAARVAVIFYLVTLCFN